MKALLYSLTLLLFSLGAEAQDHAQEQVTTAYGVESMLLQPALEPAPVAEIDSVLPAIVLSVIRRPFRPLPPLAQPRDDSPARAVVHSIRAPPLDTV